MFKLDVNDKARSYFCKEKAKVHERDTNNTTLFPPNPLCSKAIKLPPPFYLENKKVMGHHGGQPRLSHIFNVYLLCMGVEK